MKLLARSRLHGDTDTPAHEHVVEADTYDQAYAEARESVPDGWDLLSVQTIA